MNQRLSTIFPATIIGIIVGLVAAIAGEPYVYRATSGYSQRSFFISFETEPSEEALLDAVIHREPLIPIKADTTREWRKAKTEGHRLYIKVDASRSVVVSPYSPDEDPDMVFPAGGRVTGIWLTQPRTRTHFPPLLVRVAYFTAAFIAAAAATFLVSWLWYFVLARVRELSLAVRGT
jgi:hypothetical protein